MQANDHYDHSDDRVMTSVSPTHPTFFPNHENPHMEAVAAEDLPVDPHDFYRQYQPRSRRSSAQHPDIFVGPPSHHLNAPRSSIPSQAGVADTVINSTTSMQTAPESSYKPSLQPLVPVGATANNRHQGSIKDLVDQFNQSANPSPVDSKPLSNSRNRTTSASAASSQLQSLSGPPEYRSRSYKPNDAVRTTVTSNRKPTDIWNSSTSTTAAAYASKSMSNLYRNSKSPKSPAKAARKPLFGEMVFLDGSGMMYPGYGIGTQMPPRPRTNSESNIQQSPSLASHGRSLSNLEISPSLGVQPSRFDSPAEFRMPQHRRSRSDLTGLHPETLPASTFQRPDDQKSQLQQAPPTSPSSARSPPSKIPVKARRPSVASDSGSSLPSTRAESSLGYPKTRSHDAVNRSLNGPGTPGTGRDNASRQTPPPKPTFRRYDVSPNRIASSSASLKAYITAPLPKKSPPLRSSRPRQPVSAATTSASRAKMTGKFLPPKETQSRDPFKPKKIPGLDAVDFAARRARIQQAMTKSIHESEQMEAEIARHRARREQRSLSRSTMSREVSPSVNLPSARDSPSSTQPHTAAAQEAPKLTLNMEGLPPSNNPDTLTGNTEFEDEESPVLGLRTNHSQPPQDSSLSKTLDYLQGAHVQDRSQDHRETLASETPANSRPSAEPGTLLSHVLKMRASNISSTNETECTDDTRSERDDGESIQIMLGAPPGTEEPALWNAGFDTRLDTDNTPRAHRTTGTRGPSMQEHQFDEGRDEDGEEADYGFPSHRDEISIHPEDSVSQAIRTGPVHEPDPTWSSSLMDTPKVSDRQTMDSDAYSHINKVLEHYHNSQYVTPQMLHEFQQNVVAISPHLANENVWSTEENIRLYLHELAKSRFGASSLPPPSLDGSAVTPIENDDAPSATFRDSVAFDGNGTAVVYAETERYSWDTSRGFQRTDSRRESHDSYVDRPNQSESELTSGTWPKPSVSHGHDLPAPDEGEGDFRPTPPPKDWRFSPNSATTDIAQMTEARKATEVLGDFAPIFPTDGRPRLPEVYVAGEGLGLRIPTGTEQHVDPVTLSQPPVPNHSPPPPPVPATMDALGPQQEPDRPTVSPSIYTANPPSSIFPAPLPDGAFPRAAPYVSSIQMRQFATPAHAKRSSMSAVTPEAAPTPTAESESTTPSKSISPTPEQKRLTKRRHLVKELVDTEFSYYQDMQIVEDIYRGTSTACDTIKDEDRRILFSNSDQIVSFSENFLDALKQAASSIYTMPRTNRWRLKRSSFSTNHSTNTDQSSLASAEFTDDEKDRMTSVGEAFCQHMSRMEKIYSEYLKNHQAASMRLQKLQTQPKVAVWLQECRKNAQDITTAWDLDSLLVKPVQRLLKYPLLLKQILECTPEDHPDYTALDAAVREMTNASFRINEAKKRADLVDQVVNRKRKESDVRLGLSKAFGRRTEKLKQQVGLSDAFEDPEYKATSSKFGGQLFQVQIVIKDVQNSLTETEAFVEQYNNLILALEAYVDVEQCNYPEIESKWRKFALSIRELTSTVLKEHKAVVQKHVLNPLHTVMHLYEGPQTLMQKLKKRIVDYARYRTMKDRGEKVDKKTQEQGEQYLALNDTLKDELPKLYTLTKKLVLAATHSYIEIQKDWHSTWERKLKPIIEENMLPKSFQDVVDAFHTDYGYMEARIISLAICNGSMLAETSNFLSPSVTLTANSETSTLNGAPAVGRKPRPATLDSAKRTQSIGSDMSPVLPTPDFLKRQSGSFNFSPYLASIPLAVGVPLPSPGRMRASSAQSSRGPSTPVSTVPRSTSGTDAAFPFPQRPATSAGRNVLPSPALPRTSSDTPNTRPGSSSTYFSADQNLRRQSSPPTRFSGIFSSAMPMTDSPQEPRPVSPSAEQEHRDLQVLFLAASLFEFNIDRARREAGYPYLTYTEGEIFDVVGQKGELWLARNQDDPAGQIGWIWEKHFLRLPND